MTARWLLVGSLSVLTVPARAQDPILAPGASIRLVAAAFGVDPVVTRVVRLAGDSLILQTDPRLPELDKLRNDLETKFAPRFVPLLENLKAEVEALDQRSREMLVNRDSNAGNGIAEGFRNLQRKILELYREIPLEAINERTYLASNFAIAKDGEKAWYGRDDNYRPEVYEIIHKATRSSVGIFPRNGHNSGKPRGSGVVIGRSSSTGARTKAFTQSRSPSLRHSMPAPRKRSSRRRRRPRGPPFARGGLSPRTASVFSSPASCGKTPQRRLLSWSIGRRR